MASWDEFVSGAGDKVVDLTGGSGGTGRESEPMRVAVWSDGSSRGNPGRGGYGALLRYTGPDGETHERELSCGYRRTTNNRMELMGAIAALEALRRPCVVEVRTDSQYVCNAFNQHWIAGWKRRGWRTANKQPVKNVDLWQRLLDACGPHEVSWHWVKGHAGHAENERCDQLATEAADGTCLGEDEGFRG